MTQLKRYYVDKEKRFYKNQQFLGFSGFSGTLVRFPMKIDNHVKDGGLGRV